MKNPPNTGSQKKIYYYTPAPASSNCLSNLFSARALLFWSFWIFERKIYRQHFLLWRILRLSRSHKVCNVSSFKIWSSCLKYDQQPSWVKTAFLLHWLYFSFDISKLLIYQNFSLYLKVQTPCLLPRTLEMINYASQVHRLSSDFISKVGEIIINKRINIIDLILLWRYILISKIKKYKQN